MNFLSRVLLDTSLTPACRWLVGTLIVRAEHKITMHEVYRLAEPHYDSRTMLGIFEEAIKKGYVATNIVDEGNERERLEYTLTLAENSLILGKKPIINLGALNL